MYGYWTGFIQWAVGFLRYSRPENAGLRTSWHRWMRTSERQSKYADERTIRLVRSSILTTTQTKEGTT